MVQPKFIAGCNAPVPFPPLLRSQRSNVRHNHTKLMAVRTSNSFLTCLTMLPDLTIKSFLPANNDPIISATRSIL